MDLPDMTETELYEVLVGLYNDRDKFVSVAFRYIRNHEKAKDIFSESFTSILNHRDSLPETPEKIGTYLMQAVKHRCLNELRRDAVRQEGRKNLLKADCDLLLDDNITRDIVEKDVRKIFSYASTKMGSLTFDIYSASRLGNLSHKEIAGIYGITTNRVAKEIMKAAGIIEGIIRDYVRLIIIIVNTIWVTMTGLQI